MKLYYCPSCNQSHFIERNISSYVVCRSRLYLAKEDDFELRFICDWPKSWRLAEAGGETPFIASEDCISVPNYPKAGNLCLMTVP